MRSCNRVSLPAAVFTQDNSKSMHEFLWNLYVDGHRNKEGTINFRVVGYLNSYLGGDPSRSFFQDICKPTSCLYHLIPPARDTSVTTRLRVTTSLPRPNLRTKKYCSFINFGLHRYQPTQWYLTHSTHLSQHLCTSYAHCLFRLLFLSIISTA